MKKNYSIAIVSFFEASAGGHGAAEVTLSLFDAIKFKKKFFEIKKNNIFKILENHKINIFENIFKLFKIINLIIDTRKFLKNSKKKIVIIEGASWIGYSFLTIKILKILDSNTFIIYHSHNIEYLLREKKNNFIISFLSKILEKKVYQISDIGTAVSEIDQNILKKLYGVDSTIFYNGISKRKLKISLFKKKIPKDYVIYFGSYSFFPNKQAIDYIINNIFPIVRKKHPNLKLVIVGKDLPHNIIEKNKDIYFYKNIKKKYLNFLISKSKFLLAPMFKATGTKLKIIETLMLGSIVITSREGISGISLSKKISPPFIFINKKEVFNLINIVLKNNKLLKKKAKIRSNFFIKKYCMENIVKNFFRDLNL